MSLNITLFQNDKDPVQLSAITAGGSQAVFFKINTWGEEAFLDKLIELLDFDIQYRRYWFAGVGGEATKYLIFLLWKKFHGQ